MRIKRQRGRCSRTVEEQHLPQIRHQELEEGGTMLAALEALTHKEQREAALEALTLRALEAPEEEMETATTVMSDGNAGHAKELTRIE